MIPVKLKNFQLLSSIGGISTRVQLFFLLCSAQFLFSLVSAFGGSNLMVGMTVDLAVEESLK